MATTVLMYHGIPPAGGADGDPHYAVDRERFAAQVAAIHAAGRSVRSVADRRVALERPQAVAPGIAPDAAAPDAVCTDAVCMTFDDGLASNAWAAEQLAERGDTADFFVNPSTVGTAGFLDWPTLRRMADAGMSIQSHGMHHRYLDELAPAEVRAELADSRKAIEDALGRPVTIYAPAGGRMPARFVELAAELGYRTVCSSRVGLWRPAAGPGGGDAGDPAAAAEVPRIAVLAGTSASRFERWIRQAPIEMLRQTARHRLLAASKRLLGNGGHERLRGLLLAAREEKGR